MSTPTKKCLFPKCARAAKCRGLCNSHYSIALKMIRMQKVTWAELERAKKCLPPERLRGSHVQEWFLAAKAQSK